MINKIQQSDNTPKHFQYQLALPMDIGELIGMDESVRTLLEITERMDYSKLHEKYQRLPSSNEASPKQMFQLVVLGFMEDITSTRKLESASKHDIRFMYVLQRKPAPDHNRFWNFIKHRLQGEVAEQLFYQLTDYLYQKGEIDYANLFVDGTKIEACANRYSFVWKKSTNKYEEQLDIKIAEMLKNLKTAYEIPSGANPEECLAVLKDIVIAKSITFVYGRGRRKPQIQRDTETLEGYLTRKRKYEGYNQTFKGRNSFSKTDPDATFMRMKDDHMRNGQLKPGYNLQIGVEGEYIVGLDISDERNDEHTLLPLLERLEKGCGKRHINVTTDAGYESEENYKGLKARKQAAYIKPQNYERTKTRKYKSNAYLRENMPYNKEADTYICPAGKLFTPAYTTKRKSKSGFLSTVTVYECQGCTHCPQKRQCTRAKGSRKLYVSKDFLALRQESLRRITSKKGKDLRINRSIQPEGAFGVMKENHGFRRFVRRGMTNVFTETILHAMAYNVNKLHAKKLRKLSGVTFYTKKSA